MKNNKKVFIIGGGFSGCISALLLSQLGYKVSLFERGEKLGGASKDIVFDKQVFFNGPHYFNPNSKWLKLIKDKKEFKNEFKILGPKKIGNKEFNIHRSYTDLFGATEVNNLFAQPVTSLSFEKILNNKKIDTLYSRLNSFQVNVRNPLNKWCETISKISNQLHASCAERLNIGRICFINDLKRTAKIKKINKMADQILGVPKIANTEQKYCLAKNGNNSFYKKFEKLLKKKISIKFNSSIKIDCKKKNDVKIYESNNLLKADKFIWAANPVNLIKTLGYGKLDNPVTKVKIYCANIEFLDNCFFDNLYIQVFSLKTNIFRVYLYKTGSKHKITIETFFNRENKSLDKKKLKKIMKSFNIVFKFTSKIYEKKEIRHNLLTQQDYIKLSKFDKDFKNTMLIGGGWSLRGRENKINHIMKHFN